MKARDDSYDAIDMQGKDTDDSNSPVYKMGANVSMIMMRLSRKL